jgi:hypothetical protein
MDFKRVSGIHASRRSRFLFFVFSEDVVENRESHKYVDENRIKSLKAFSFDEEYSFLKLIQNAGSYFCINLVSRMLWVGNSVSSSSPRRRSFLENRV